MKNYLKLILLLFVVVQTFSSCDKSFLDEKIYSSYSPTTLNDSLGFEASVVGLHNQLSNFYTYSGNQGWLSVWQIGTDIAYAGQQEGIEIPYYNYALLISTDNAASRTWSWAYSMINNTNIIIANVENPAVGGMTQNNKNSIDAEARFFRAYAYNILATCFGKVPVVRQPLSAPKTDFVRYPIDSVNNIIEQDLLFAGTYLPTIDNVKKANGKPLYARANKAMAQQLLAEAYLRMNRPADAETQCKAIIASNKFILTTARFGIHAKDPGTPFADMFFYGNERRSQGNNEVIWNIEMENPNTVTGGITGDPQQRRVWGAAYYQITGMSICDSLGGRSIARLRLDNWVLYKLYEPGDMRNERFSIRRRYVYNNPAYPATYGKLVPYAGADTIYKICPALTKFGQYNPLDEFGYDMIKDLILMRFAETYLLMAEAQFKLGHMDDAAASLNVVRTRANVAAVTAADVNLDFILDERARELIGEENRRMTLMRTGTLVDRTTRLNTDAGAFHPVVGISDKNLLMPIPQNEINLNKDAVLEQNPGY
jgi:starch-binding outer membrane protein, SusD/RagB family